MADAAHVILAGDATFPTGHFLIDDEVLTAAGITDLNGYRYAQGDADLQLDIFL
jgi:citronellol/citronellal dehydrogenase